MIPFSMRKLTSIQVRSNPIAVRMKQALVKQVRNTWSAKKAKSPLDRKPRYIT